MRCQRLNSDGKRCKRNAKYFVTMHQGECTYDSEPKWCVTGVCGWHHARIIYPISEKDYPVKKEIKKKKSSVPTTLLIQEIRKPMAVRK